MPRVGEVAGGLFATRRRIGGLRQHRQHQVQRRHAHAHAEDDVAVVGGEPVVLGFERPADSDLRRLVAGAGDDERRSALTVQDLEAVVDLATQKHVVEPLGEDVLVEVGVAPHDRLLESPIGAERRVPRLGRLRHLGLEVDGAAVHRHRRLHHRLAQRRVRMDVAA